MMEWIAGTAFGVIATSILGVALLTPPHVTVCEHEGGEWRGEVCIKDGRVILDDRDER